MSILVRFTGAPGMTAEKYDETMPRIEASGTFPSPRDACTFAQIRSATSRPARASVSGRMIANSSPPWREAMSVPRRLVWIARATRPWSRQPTCAPAWPRVPRRPPPETASVEE